jgi:hypothetical protein
MDEDTKISLLSDAIDEFDRRLADYGAAEHAYGQLVGTKANVTAIFEAFDAAVTARCAVRECAKKLWQPLIEMRG